MLKTKKEAAYFGFYVGAVTAMIIFGLAVFIL